MLIFRRLLNDWLVVKVGSLLFYTYVKGGTLPWLRTLRTRKPMENSWKTHVFGPLFTKALFLNKTKKTLGLTNGNFNVGFGCGNFFLNFSAGEMDVHGASLLSELVAQCRWLKPWSFGRGESKRGWNCGNGDAFRPRLTGNTAKSSILHFRN